MDTKNTSSRPDSTSKTVGLAFFWSMIGNSFGQGMSLILFLYIAKFVSQESFGIMAVCLMTIEIAKRLVLDPIAITLKSKSQLSDFDLNNAFTFVMLASGGVALLLFVFSSPLAYLLGTSQISIYLPFMAPILLGFGLTRIQDVWLSRAMQYRSLAIRNILSVLAGGGVGVSMALNGMQIWSLIGQQLAISLVSMITLWAATPWRPKLTLSHDWLARHANQSGHNSIANLWASLSQDSDIYFVSAILGPAAAGLFNASRRIMLAVTITLTFAISSVSLSALANIADERKRAESMMMGLAATCLITMPAFSGLSLIGVNIVALVLPSHWSYAGQILSIMSIGGIALTLHALCGAMLSVSQRADLNNLCSGITAIVTLVAYWFAARLGLLPMAWAVVFTGFATLPLRFFFIRRVVGVSWSEIFSAMAPALCASALMYGLTLCIDYTFLSHRGVLSLTVTICSGGLTYVTCLRLISKHQFDMLFEKVWQHLPASRWRRGNRSESA